ncbi:MAG TPA: hemerythrin domain-containing protein [Dongiaceae bacterium]|jgi:hemerythrin superfamily protein|nr:hemerythrin domain-containing protein [Dongiaceae bacterium]
MPTTTRSRKTKAKSKSKSSAARQDAVALLKADHRKVEGLFRKAEKASGSAKEKLVGQICSELIVHTTLEEEIFYPACRAEDVEEDKMDEAQVEHDGAKVLINDLMGAGADSEAYDAKVKVLSEYIKHHVKEEEKPRTGVFAEARRKGLDMTEIGRQIGARKEELMTRAGEGGLPRPKPKMVDVSAGGSGRPRAETAERSSGGALRSMALAAKRAAFGE